jgi:hypothetical protein
MDNFINSIAFVTTVDPLIPNRLYRIDSEGMHLQKLVIYIYSQSSKSDVGSMFNRIKTVHRSGSGYFFGEMDDVDLRNLFLLEPKRFIEYHHHDYTCYRFEVDMSSRQTMFPLEYVEIDIADFGGKATMKIYLIRKSDCINECRNRSRHDLHVRWDMAGEGCEDHPK